MARVGTFIFLLLFEIRWFPLLEKASLFLFIPLAGAANPLDFSHLKQQLYSKILNFVDWDRDRNRYLMPWNFVNQIHNWGNSFFRYKSCFFVFFFFGVNLHVCFMRYSEKSNYSYSRKICTWDRCLGNLSCCFVSLCQNSYFTIRLLDLVSMNFEVD